MTKYAKAIVALFTALGTWGATSLADGTIQPAEYFGLSAVIVAAALVWAVPNKETP